MSDDVVTTDGGLAAIIGLLVLHNDGPFRIPVELIEAGLPENHKVFVEPDLETEELVVGIREA